MSAARLLALLPFLLAPRLAWAQFEDQKLTPSSPILNAHFGQALDADEGKAIVGAPGTAPFTGRVSFLEQSGSSWSQIAEFAESAGPVSADFGFSVALSGDCAVVGAPFLSANSADPGSAYVYERLGGAWTEVAQLEPSDGEAEDEFGFAVAVDGNTLMVGSRKAGPVDRAGAVYVFERIAGSWIETQKLSASNAAINDRFGVTIELDGATAAIAAPYEDNNGGNQAGRVYVFDHDGASWSQTQMIKEEEGEPSAFFGTALALEGDTLMASTLMTEVYVFERVGGFFLEVERILPASTSISEGFGASVDLSGDSLLVGAPFSWIGTETVGSAQLFQRTPSGWSIVNSLVTSDREDGDRLGEAVAIDGTSLLIGMQWDDDVAMDSGAVYAFTPSNLDTEPYCFCDYSVAPCQNPVSYAGCATETTGRGARLDAVGSTSIASDDLILLVGDVPPNTFGLVVVGSSQILFPFGNGLRCVGASGVGLYRLPAQSSGSDGLMQYGPGIVAHAAANFGSGVQIQPGDEWNFQMWFRDVHGECLLDFNTSNALSAVFGH